MARKNVSFLFNTEKRCSMLPNGEFIDFTSRLTVIKYESVREVQPWESPACLVPHQQPEESMPYLGISLLSVVSATVCAPIIMSGSFGKFFSKLRQVANQV